MARPRKHERVAGRYFTWILTRRNGVWQADGRSNPTDAGRHSLGTKDHAEARRRLARLDLTVAARLGLADPAALADAGGRELPLAEGRRLYEARAARPRVAGGVRPSSRKRYRAVFDKFLAYAEGQGLEAWNRVTAGTVEGYLARLEAEGYSYRTQYLEGTTVKQAVAWLVRAKHLPASCKIHLPLAKPQGTDTHCWKPAEVRAILGHCRATPGLGWLGDVLTALTYTGLRIGELVDLRWADIDLEAGVVRLADETASRRPRGARAARTLKGGRGRSLPVKEELRRVLAALARHPDGYVFHGPCGGRLKADTVRRALVRDVLTPLAEKFPTAAGEAGFAVGRLHSFRHFFCSLCATSGVAQQVVMWWLGHRDSKMVEHYFTLHDEEARRQMSRVALPEVEDAGGA